MKTARIRTPRAGKKGTNQTIDYRLMLQGKSLKFWLPQEEKPVIKHMMREWGEDLRGLSRVDGYHLIYWLIDELIKSGWSEEPSDAALEFYKNMNQLTQAEKAWCIMSIMHRKKG